MNIAVQSQVMFVNRLITYLLTFSKRISTTLNILFSRFSRGHLRKGFLLSPIIHIYQFLDVLQIICYIYPRVFLSGFCEAESIYLPRLTSMSAWVNIYSQPSTNELPLFRNNNEVNLGAWLYLMLVILASVSKPANSQ